MAFTVRIGGSERAIELEKSDSQFFPSQGNIVKTMIAKVSSNRFQTLAITTNGTWLDEYPSLEQAVSALQAWYDTLGI